MSGIFTGWSDVGTFVPRNKSHIHCTTKHRVRLMILYLLLYHSYKKHSVCSFSLTWSFTNISFLPFLPYLTLKFAGLSEGFFRVLGGGPRRNTTCWHLKEQLIHFSRKTFFVITPHKFLVSVAVKWKCIVLFFFHLFPMKCKVTDCQRHWCESFQLG